jgi:hypothetical protein
VMLRIIRLAKLQLFVFIALFMISAATGPWRFPDAPVRQCGAEQFCGRSGGLHSEMEFKSYVAWERTTLILFPVAVASVGILVWLRRRRANYLQRLLVKQRDLSPAVEELRYEAAWADLRRRKIVVLAMGLAAAVTAVASRLIGFPGAALPVALVMLIPFALIWLYWFACPRCRERFVSLRSPSRCRFCRLQHGATFSESLGELDTPKFACN